VSIEKPVHAQEWRWQEKLKFSSTANCLISALEALRLCANTRATTAQTIIALKQIGTCQNLLFPQPSKNLVEATAGIGFSALGIQDVLILAEQSIGFTDSGTNC
jgi:hypothetical protein